MHTIMPLERIGAPWPPSTARRRLASHVASYKDPNRVDDGDWARVGMKPPK